MTTLEFVVARLPVSPLAEIAALGCVIRVACAYEWVHCRRIVGVAHAPLAQYAAASMAVERRIPPLPGKRVASLPVVLTKRYPS
jgi:hypothetical protein